MPDNEKSPPTELLERLGQNDYSAIQPLYDEFGKLIFSLSFKILGNRLEAEEVVQDTFVAVWNNASDLAREPQKLVPWMIRTARNRSIDSIRKRDRRIPNTDLIYESEDSAGPTGPVERDTALDALVLTERASAVKRAIQSLPENQKVVIRLAYFKGMSQSEIAQELSESLGTIKSRIRYAMTKLRRELEGTHAS